MKNHFSLKLTLSLGGGASILAGLVQLVTQLAPHLAPPAPNAEESAGPRCVRAIEHRHMTLDDGSTIELNANSCVAVLYSPTQRQIQLLEGEAIFSASPDPKRPFTVKIRNTSVVAIGTQFDVDAQSERTRVLVMEGRVGIYRTPGDSLPAARQTPVELDAGRLIDILDDSDGPEFVRAVKPEDLTRITAWLNGKIVGNRVGDFLAEFPRYDNIEFSPVDPRMPDTPMYGQFPVNGLDLFLKSLEELYCIRGEPHLNASGKRTFTLTRIHGTSAKCR